MLHRLILGLTNAIKNLYKSSTLLTHQKYVIFELNLFHRIDLCTLFCSTYVTAKKTSKLVSGYVGIGLLVTKAILFVNQNQH